MDYMELLIILVGVIFICLIIIAARTSAQHARLKRFEEEEKKRKNGTLSRDVPRTGSYCPNCGSGVSEDDKFCKKCGGKLN